MNLQIKSTINHKQDPEKSHITVKLPVRNKTKNHKSIRKIYS